MVSSNLTMSNFLAPCFLFVSCQIDFLQKIHCVFIYVGNVAKNATSPFFNVNKEFFKAKSTIHDTGE